MAKPMTKTETTEKTVSVSKKKKFEKDEYIPCMSVTAGTLLMSGSKSGRLYCWNYNGAVEEVEYQDLFDAVHRHSADIFLPRIVIQDDDFLEQNPKVAEVYTTMYSTSDLKEILSLPPEQLRSVAADLPVGVQESLKSIASSMIASGTLDSVSRIKVLDEVFNTKLMLLTELFNG